MCRKVSRIEWKAHFMKILKQFVRYFKKFFENSGKRLKNEKELLQYKITIALGPEIFIWQQQNIRKWTVRLLVSIFDKKKWRVPGNLFYFSHPTSMEYCVERKVFIKEKWKSKRQKNSNFDHRTIDNFEGLDQGYYLGKIERILRLCGRGSGIQWKGLFYGYIEANCSLFQEIKIYKDFLKK